MNTVIILMNGGLNVEQIPSRVSLVTIGCLDLPALRLFYQKLGWQELELSSDEFCVFRTAGVNVTEMGLPARISRIALAINVDSWRQSVTRSK
jgi:hypothetical protein